MESDELTNAIRELTNEMKKLNDGMPFLRELTKGSEAVKEAKNLQARVGKEAGDFVKKLSLQQIQRKA